ncbi:hypothetical protein AYO44_14625 [Planctomycetaceae bacterium SCGC AG-212-F19]|nr:hypothetical protein AYO44_14625 [Planctomycetaceae bacterium SCGC AG-212-F19]
MFALLWQFFAQRRMAKRSRLVKLAKQADELLIGCSTLTPQTRQMLQQQREELETEIRALSVT